MQLLKNVNQGTLKQLKFIGNNTNIDLKAVDTGGMNVFHYLSLNNFLRNVDAESYDEDYAEEYDEDHEEDMVDVSTKDKNKKNRKELCNILIQCGEYLLSKGVDLNLISTKGTPLALSLANYNKEFTLWLLKKGASIKTQDDEGRSILFHIIKAATQHGVSKIVKDMLASKDSLKILQQAAKEYTHDGETFDRKLVKKFLKNHANSRYGRQQSIDELNVSKKMMKLLKIFLDMKLEFGNPLGMTKKGREDCKRAREQGYTEEQVLAISLDRVRRKQYWNEDEVNDKNKTHSDKLGMYREWVNINEKDKFKYYDIDNTKDSGNILHLLINTGKKSRELIEETLKLLSGTKSNFDKKNLHGHHPLMLALLTDKQALVNQLIVFKFDPNNTNEIQKLTCLHLAAQNSDAEVINYLIEAGGDVNARDALGNTPLHYAAYGRNLQATRLLLKAGADPNAVNDKKNTPLHISFAKFGQLTGNSIELEELLIKHKASINAKNTQLRTPFFFAFKGSSDPVELTTKVIELPKYDLNMQDSKGKTALHLACERGNILSVLAMIKAGAKLTVKDRRKNTPLAEAFVSGETQLCSCLLQEIEPDLCIYQEKEQKLPNEMMTKSEFEEYKKNVEYEKYNVYSQAMKLNNNGLLFMLSNKGFPLHKAVKTAIKQCELKLATNLFSANESKLKNYTNKKDGMNLYCYFAYHCKKADSTAISEFQSALKKAGVSPLSKSKSGLTAIHAAAYNDQQTIVQAILDSLSTSEITKQIKALAKFSKDSDIKHNPISFLVSQNKELSLDFVISNLSTARKGNRENFKRVVRRARTYRVAKRYRKYIQTIDGRKKPKETKQSCLTYLLQLCKDKKIKIPEDISFNPKDPQLKFFNYHLYSHLFKGVDVVDTTLLNYAVMLGDLRLTASLAGQGFSVNEKDSEGRTALMYAVLSGKIEMVEFLLGVHNIYSHNQTINLNDKDEEGRTALMLCLEQVFVGGEKVTPIREDIFTTLLEQKAQTNIKDNKGKTFTELLNKLPGNEAYVEAIKKILPSFKATMNSYKKSTDVDMDERVEYDYNKDCKKYFEQKYKNIKTYHKDEKVEVDSISNMENKAEVVKGDK